MNVPALQEGFLLTRKPLSIILPPAVTDKAHHQQWGSGQVKYTPIQRLSRLFTQLLRGFSADRTVCLR